MERIRDWIEIIQGGGWNGLLMAGFACVAVLIVLAFSSNRYFWIGLALVTVATLLGGYHQSVIQVAVSAG